MARVTSADVARASGVSRTTVSYVLNGTEGASISAETRQRVFDAAERLGYAPSAAARVLRSGRSDLVLCMLPDWPVGPVVETLLDHLADDLAARGLSVLVHHARGERPLAELWRAVTPRTVVGLAAFEPAEVQAMRRAGIQVVDTSSDEATASDPQPVIGEIQVERLVAGGRTRLGYAATADRRVAEFADRRLDGVRAACATRSIEPPVVVELEVDAASGARAVDVWRAAGVTGVAAYNDEIAFAVLAGARSRGLAVPGDLAVIGVDDVPLAALASPPLTTVTQSMDLEAAYLAARVIAAIDGAPPPKRTGGAPALVVRDSA